jgi:hypothetical protein
MLMHHVALVSIVPDISLAEVAIVAAAIQKQVARDLAPTWDVTATVAAYARVEDVPAGDWLVTVGADAGRATGVHLDRDGLPYALVEPGEHWSLVASHECLEMLVNPFGDRFMKGPSLREGHGPVDYLLEICDPSQAAEHAYTIDGVLVSDFYTPAFFAGPTPAARYSHTDAIEAPLRILPGGYLTWHDPATDHWWLDTFLRDPKESPRDLGVVERTRSSARAMLYDLSPRPLHTTPRPHEPAFAVAAAKTAAARAATPRKRRV